ncbi:hypothetical protein [Lignipirellula cremea]|uniref:hypothetical protein n=1 Tax=Lignipirellula cremea TaxID=2528010 RepID=UPI0011AB05D0|nr:hypothetical protein [Lignipirellula cremea]
MATFSGWSDCAAANLAQVRRQTPEMQTALRSLLLIARAIFWAAQMYEAKFWAGMAGRGN